MEAGNGEASSASSNVEPAPLDMEEAANELWDQLKMAFNLIKGVDADKLKTLPTASILGRINEIVQGAWEAPNHSSYLGSTCCDFLRSEGVIDFVLNNTHFEDIQLSSAKLLKNSLLTEENREHVINYGLKQAVSLAASVCKKCQQTEPECCRAAMGIIECLLDDSERVCSEIVDLGGFDTILFGCRKTDGNVLQHCARAIANLSLYGNADVYAVMSRKRVTMWLFPLAFYSDNIVKYYSLIATSALYANGFEAASERANLMYLARMFVTSHRPIEFLHSDRFVANGHRGPWLKGLVPLLSSGKEEIRMLASFHFCMEAIIKKSQGKETVFNDIGAIQSLQILASNQDPIASGFASQALKLLGVTKDN